ncbi:hypothetical protein JMG10_19870 [Nostoc ellipsosporum NOK]|nr:hypothetical protein [Nostoc ellipsosporum NOK]
MSNEKEKQTMSNLEASDTRFHMTLFGSLANYNEKRPPLLYYVENGNAIAGYDQLAFDYKMTADLLINTSKESGLGNWFAPTLLVVRQTLELALKALLEATVDRGNSSNKRIMFSHDLWGIWAECRRWLEANGYSFLKDMRLEIAEWVIENFHAVDPTGDLFRFAHSKHEAFKRKKTYDRAGVNDAVFADYFNAAWDFLNHWQGVLVMEWMEREALREGISYTKPFDPDDFPRED